MIFEFLALEWCVGQLKNYGSFITGMSFWA